MPTSSSLSERRAPQPRTQDEYLALFHRLFDRQPLQPSEIWKEIKYVEFIAAPRSKLVARVLRLKQRYHMPACALMEKLPNGDYRLRFTRQQLMNVCALKDSDEGYLK